MQVSDFSQFDELDVEALDLLEHLILGEDLLQREGLLVEDVVDGTVGCKTGETTNKKSKKTGEGWGKGNARHLREHAGASTGYDLS